MARIVSLKWILLAVFFRIIIIKINNKMKKKTHMFRTISENFSIILRPAAKCSNLLVTSSIVCSLFVNYRIPIGTKHEFLYYTNITG